MARDNGGIIGKLNTPTTSVASGVWALEDQYQAQLAGTWPLVYPLTTFNNSVRLDTDTTFTRTLGASPTNAKKGTISFWFKKVETPNSSDYGRFVHIGSTGNDLSLYTISDYFQWYIDGGTNGTSSTSGARLYRDHSAWYHIIYAFDSTQATAADRIKIYINGELQDSTAQPTSTSVTLNTDIFDASHDFCIGATNSTSLSQNLDGYLAEFIYIDGQQLTPTSFGATYPSGIWGPKAYAGTYGTNGFKLNFSDSSALGDDTSGNGNDFTANNLTSIDQSTDTPSNNFATLNPLDVSRLSNTDNTFSNGNLSVTDGSSNYLVASGTMSVTKGKWYFEVKIDATTSNTASGVGIVDLDDYDRSDGAANTAYGWIYAPDGDKRNNSTSTAYGDTYATNDIIGVAIDMDNLAVYYSKNGVFQNSGDPTSGASKTNAAFTNLTGTITAHVYDGSSAQAHEFSMNFGSPPYSISSGNSDGNGYGNFEYSVPSGYYALNSKNLAEYG